MRFQWALALLVIGLFGLSCVLTKKKQAKRDPSTLEKPRPGKRWMPPSGFNGFPSREADMAFDDHFAAQEAGYTGPPQDPYTVPGFGNSVGQAMGIKDPTLTNSFKNSDQDDTSAAAYAQEVATYLKPGIGDYPSDMPAGYKGDLGLGLALGGKIKGNKMAPIASFAHPEPPDLLHEFKDKSESNELLAGGTIVHEAGSVSNKSDEGSIPGAEDAKIAPEKPKEDKKKPVTGQRRQGELYQLPMMTSNYEPVGLPQVAPPSVYGGGDMKGDDTTVAATNSEDSPSSLDAGENPESSLPAKPAAKNEEEDKEPAAEAKEDEPAAGVKGAKVAKEDAKEDAAAGTDEKTPGNVKQKLVSSLRQALLENIGDMMKVKGKEGKEDKGGKEEEEGSGDAGGEKAEETKEKEAAGAKNEKETEKAAAEESTNNKAAAPDDKEKEDKAEKAEKAAEAAAIEEKMEKAEASEKEGQKASASEGERSAADEQKTQQLESNLMKIDKKKLVHLLATLMQKNKKEMEEEEGDDGEDDEDKGKGTDKSKAAHNPDKVKEAISAEATEAAKGQSDKPSFAKGGKGEKADKEETSEEAKGDESKQEEPSKQAPKEESAEKIHKQRSSKPTALIAAVMAVDPYAQIGLVDPSNNDKSLSFSKDSVSKSKHAKETQEESPKEEETPKEEDSPKASSKASKEEEDDKEEAPKAAAPLMSARAQAIQEAKQLAKMKLLAKEEKAKQELKAIQKMEKDADEKEAEEAGEDAQSVNAEAPKEKEKEKQKPTSKLANFKALASPTGAHLSPALVQAIAENLQNGGLAALAGGGKAKESSATEGTKTKEAAKESKSAKDESADAEEDKEDEADQSPDGPNIQTLIQHMKQRLQNNGSGGKKQSSASGKSKRRGKSYYDDAYSQIGAMDPNIKKKKTLIHRHHSKHHHSSD